MAGGPAQPEGRVSGPARALALDMNAIILRNRVQENAGANAVNAWNRLEEVHVPVTVACGEFLPDQRSPFRVGGAI